MSCIMTRLAGWDACGKESKFTATAGATTLPLAAAFLSVTVQRYLLQMYDHSLMPQGYSRAVKFGIDL